MCIYIYIYTCAFIYKDIHIYIYIHIKMPGPIHECVYTIYMYIYLNMYATQIYIYIYTGASKSWILGLGSPSFLVQRPSEKPFNNIHVFPPNPGFLVWASCVFLFKILLKNLSKIKCSSKSWILDLGSPSVLV